MATIRCPQCGTEFEKGSVEFCPNPNCGYSGPPERKSKGSGLILILLLLLWVLPGILYAIIYNGYALSCPRCGVKVRDE